MPPPTPSSALTSTLEVSASPDAGSTIPDARNTSKALVTVGRQKTNKGESIKCNDPMVISTGEMDKVVGSASFGLKRKKEEDILKWWQG